MGEYKGKVIKFNRKVLYFTFRNGFPSYKEEMHPILEELGYTVEVNKEFIKISWKDDKKLHD